MAESRGMERREFRRIIDSQLFNKRVDIPGFSGEAGILEIRSTTEPWRVNSAAGSVVIADAGYRWLQLCPNSGRWWLTVMYDQSGELVQYYFDIISSAYISETGEPRFIDLYLDVVMSADGTWKLLDRDELDAALACGKISAEMHATALIAANELVSLIDGQEPYWRRLCASVMRELNK